mmetsp:Transcript_29451/g.80342  ORF Transcript_29451/g.80342 Transcript_29451/m.80342 type:complete len:113 (+) Transcript_29451:1990-2328(+)
MPGDCGRRSGQATLCSDGSGLQRCCRRELEAAAGKVVALPNVGLIRWLPLGERPPGREKVVGGGVFRIAGFVGEGGFAVGEGVLRFLMTAVASADGVTGLHPDSKVRGVDMV